MKHWEEPVVSLQVFKPSYSSFFCLSFRKIDLALSYSQVTLQIASKAPTRGRCLYLQGTVVHLWGRLPHKSTTVHCIQITIFLLLTARHAGAHSANLVNCLLAHNGDDGFDSSIPTGSGVTGTNLIVKAQVQVH